ncbi:predicted protein [Aspergillus terreus NIH2624]|uniref:Uncharacterized protein n=1 Tax=Aspergillus terreus (strain NIH 2624 / FGSC A1156) TaxID=341663 RepID=Q0CT92_ASPTN|nr:uncharacterized protein ATEG_03092 [Aspergillus terreus NIH2624]EAU36366.1 predicted protein [Aspergillus terreus NIH2624]
MGSTDKTSQQTPYETLSASLYSPDYDQHDWWHGAAPALGKILQDADYDVHRQYQYLSLFAHHIVPALGPSPRNTRPALYQSVLDTAGFLKLSQNFQQFGCTTRLLLEPTSYHTNVVGNRINGLLTPETLTRLQHTCDSDIDLQPYHQIAGELVLSTTEQGRLQQQNDGRIPDLLRLTDYIGLDLRPDGHITLKYYRSLLGKATATGTTASTLAFRAIRRADTCGSREPALARIEGYLHDRTQEQEQGRAPPETAPQAFVLSCDLVDVARARFKIYILDPLVSMDRVADLWTLGGRLGGVPEVVRGLELLRELWAVLGLEEGYHFLSCDAGTDGGGVHASRPRFFDNQFLFAYFELRPGDPYPRPQMYFNLGTLRDSAVVDTVSAFFEKLGWMDRARRYKEDVSSYYPSCNLDESFDRLGVLSFSYTAEQGPYITTYYRRVADLL